MENEIKDAHSKESAQFSLLKKLVAVQTKQNDLLEEAYKLKKIIKTDLPAALESEAPPELPALCFDLGEVYEQFEDFLVFRDLIGKNIVALGGGFSTGKSSFLNEILSTHSEDRVRLLPTNTAASTAVPTYLLHADGAESIHAINVFDSRISDLTAADVQAIGHDFEKDNEGVSLGQLIQRMFIASPRQPYTNIAFLDTPGYSKPDADTYSARTDEQIAREQLNHSHFILWFVNGSLIPQSDIDFLKQLDPHIPKAVILNKADKVLTQGADTYREVIESIRQDLAKNGTAVKGVWGYTRSPRYKKEIASDIQAVQELLTELNTEKTKSRFGRDFMKLFTECRKYYRKELSAEKARLQRVNKVLLLSENEEIRKSLDESRMILTDRIRKLERAQENLEEQKAIFFDVIRKVAVKVHIDIPTPSELEMLEETAGDPGALLAKLMKKSGTTEHVVMTAKLRNVLVGDGE